MTDIEKHNQAIADIKEYMGEERFNKITQEFKRFEPDNMNIEKFTSYVSLLSLSGIQGYPVKAWYNYCYGL